MFTARRRDEAATASTASAGHRARARVTIRKQGLIRAAVTVTATGLALAVPLGSHALAQLNPAVLRSMHLDSATVKRVKAYDRYRTREAVQRGRAKRALSFGRKQIGKPYRWGAEGPHGYDCSGLAMAAWRRAGVHLPRVTYAQYRKVKRKVRLRDLRPGDLVFFRGRGHVGMYVGKGRFLHAPHTGARVRIDKLAGRRKKLFAGAVRPGAPVRKEWSASVKELVEKIDRMGAQKRADKEPPDNQRAPQIPPPADMLPRSPGRQAPDPAPGRAWDETAAQHGAAPRDGAGPEPGPGWEAQYLPGHERVPWAEHMAPMDDLPELGHVPD